MSTPWKLCELAHDVVTTLGFGCILVATSDNVVTILSQRCVSDVVITTKNERCYNVVFSTSVFWNGINVAATSWFSCRFPDENLKMSQYHYNVFSKDMEYCLGIPFFDKQNLFCMCQCKAFAQMVDIWKFAACCMNREKIFLILYSSLISSLFSGGKFGRVVV